MKPFYLENREVIQVSLEEDRSIRISTSSRVDLVQCGVYAAVRRAGKEAWKEARNFDCQVLSLESDQVLLCYSEGSLSAHIRYQKLNAHTWVVSGTICNTGDSPLEVARFHYLDGALSDRAVKLISLRQYELAGKMVEWGEELEAPRRQIESIWGSWGVFWPRLNDPLHDSRNVAISGDCGMLSTGYAAPGLFFGFFKPGRAFGELGLRTQSAEPGFYLSVLLDGIRLNPGEERELEHALISCGMLQDEYKQWMDACAKEMKSRPISTPLAGYCSWYRMFQNISPEELHRVVGEYAAWPSRPGGKTIQLDDGYQKMPGDWSPNSRWAGSLEALPEMIRNSGAIPGIWVAPTAIHASHPIVQEHPEWLQRLPNGDFAVSFRNWAWCGEENSLTYFLEPDHPQAREYIRGMLKELTGRGWEYFKLDFTCSLSTARAPYDTAKTSFETLRALWELLRESLGDDTLINACFGGIYRFAIGAVDMARIGGDVAGSVESVKRGLAEIFLRVNSNGRWWISDPDVYYLSRDNEALTDEMCYLATVTVGLMGGLFLTSEYPSRWTEEAKELVGQFFNEQAPAMPLDHFALLRQDGLPQAYVVAYGEESAERYRIALYNWEEKPVDITLSLRELRISEDMDWKLVKNKRGRDITLTAGRLELKGQPGPSLRYVGLALQGTPPLPPA